MDDTLRKEVADLRAEVKRLASATTTKSLVSGAEFQELSKRISHNAASGQKALLDALDQTIDFSREMARKDAEDLVKSAHSATLEDFTRNRAANIKAHLQVIRAFTSELRG